MSRLLFLLVAATFYALALTGGLRSRTFLVLGLLVNAGFVVLRGFANGRLPVTERLDILALTGLLFAASCLWLPECRKGEMDVPVLSLSIFFLFAALLQDEVNTVDQYMKSPWFYLYSGFFILALVSLGLSSCFGVAFIRHEDISHEALQYRFGLYGWVAYAASLIFGSFWFFAAYGTLWYWTAKDFWLSIVWFYYGGLYFHGRYHPSLAGVPASIIGVLGYPLVLFGYFGIGYLIKSPWSQF